MKTQSPRIGLCPIGKFVFSHEDAVRQKIALQKRLSEWQVCVTDLDGVLEDGMIRDQSHVDVAVRHFRNADIDALFIPHCNFGTEGAAAMIAKKLNVPTLLWGPRDEAPLADGTRLRDSLCGMFATSKVLHKLGVPFTYIENCRLDEAAFRDGFDTFVRAAHVANAFRKGVRIGCIGQRIDFFWTTIINESELLERFNVELYPFDMVEFIRHAKSRVVENRSAYAQEVTELKKTYRVEDLDDGAFMHVLAVRDQMLALAADHGLEGLAIQDFMSLVNEMGAYCFYADSAVADQLAVGYESDVHGAMSGVLLRRAGLGAQATFLADVTVRHPEDDNGVLLWHAGAPLSMKHPDAKVTLGHHWILPSPLSGMTHFRLREGAITVCRFDGDRGVYTLAVGDGQSMPGPETQNNYVWMKVDDWPRWERVLMEGPFIHHMAMVYGHYKPALIEACKYIGMPATIL